LSPTERECSTRHWLAWARAAVRQASAVSSHLSKEIAVSYLIKMLTTRNVGTVDRLLRLLPTPVVAYLIHQGQLTGVAAWALGAVAAMLLVTTITGSCSIYYLLGFSTCPISGKRRPD